MVTATRKSPTKHKAKKKAAPVASTNTQPYPIEYREKVVALLRGTNIEEAKKVIETRKLSVIPSTAWDWKRTHEKHGYEALRPKRSNTRDVSQELKRLGHVQSGWVRRGHGSNGNSNGNGVVVASSASVAPQVLVRDARLGKHATPQPDLALLEDTIKTEDERIRRLIKLHEDNPDVLSASVVLQQIKQIIQ